MVCQHTDKYTKECLSKRGSVLGYFSKCNLRTQSSAQYDLCHECRRYWADHQISEQEASRSYVSYRQAHNHDGPLSPTLILSVDDAVQAGSFRATGESGQAFQTSAEPWGIHIRQLQNMTPMLYGRPQSDKRSSDASVRTQWPSPPDLESDCVQTSPSQSQQGKGKGRKDVRSQGKTSQNKTVQSGAMGVLLLSEDEEGPPKWI